LKLSSWWLPASFRTPAAGAATASSKAMAGISPPDSTEVAQAQVHVHVGVDEALVDAFVAADKQDGAGAGRPGFHLAVVQRWPIGEKSTDRRGVAPVRPARSPGSAPTDPPASPCRAAAEKDGRLRAVVALGVVAQIPRRTSTCFVS
jgi:hypothetical protein